MLLIPQIFWSLFSTFPQMHRAWLHLLPGFSYQRLPPAMSKNVLNAAPLLLVV